MLLTEKLAEYISYQWDRVCSIFSGAGKFCLTHFKSDVRTLNIKSDFTFAPPWKIPNDIWKMLLSEVKCQNWKKWRIINKTRGPWATSLTWVNCCKYVHVVVMMFIVEIYLIILNLVTLCENWSPNGNLRTVKMSQYSLILLFLRPEFDRFIWNKRCFFKTKFTLVQHP